MREVLFQEKFTPVPPTYPTTPLVRLHQPLRLNRDRSDASPYNRVRSKNGHRNSSAGHTKLQFGHTIIISVIPNVQYVWR